MVVLEWMWKICPPLAIASGTFGNTMMVVILFRLKTGWSAMNMYLSALAVCDTCVLYSGFLRNYLVKVHDYDLRAVHSVICKLNTWVFSLCATLSPWILVALTVQRAASVVWPHRVNLICTRTRSQLVVLSLTLIVSVLYSHILYGFDVVYIGNGTDASSTMVYYDYTNKRLAASTNATTPAGQKAVLILSLYESSEGGVQYTLDLMTKTCSKKQITSPMEKQCIPEFAKRDPQTIFYGSGESKLKAQRYSMNIQPGMLSATVSTTPDQCVPVTEVVYGVLDSTTGESVLQAIEFNDVTVGDIHPNTSCAVSVKRSYTKNENPWLLAQI
nr:hypothetical protein BaRGS_020348 [Batillaria attramentaria]